MAYAIKVRKIGTKRWAFLSSANGMNYLRVHAIQFEEKAAAEKVWCSAAEANPEYEWNVVEL